jgi:hypothetical protein
LFFFLCCFVMVINNTMAGAAAPLSRLFITGSGYACKRIRPWMPAEVMLRWSGSDSLASVHTQPDRRSGTGYPGTRVGLSDREGNASLARIRPRFVRQSGYAKKNRLEKRPGSRFMTTGTIPYQPAVPAIQVSGAG